MSEKMNARVLLLTVSAGVKDDSWDVFQEEWNKKGVQCERVNLFSCWPSWFVKNIMKFFLHMIKKTPFLWRWIYRRTDEPYRFPTMTIGSTFIWARAIERIRLSRPTIIIAAHPLATLMASLAIRCDVFKTKPSLFSLVTEYACHGMSLTKEATAVFLPDQQEVMVQQKAFPFSRFVHGCVPIEVKYEERVKKDELRERLGLRADVRIASLNGGNNDERLAYKKIIQSFERCEKEWVIYCFTSENERLRRMLSKVKSRHDVRVISESHAFVDYVKASDIVIVKPEGVAVTEAKAAQVPTIMVKPLPGQEEANVQRVIKHPQIFCVTDVKTIGERAEKVIQKQLPIDQDASRTVSAEEMIETMINLDELEREKAVSSGEKGHLYRFHHELMMRKKREEEREFHS